ncbi:MAG: V-type ATP synthase subunit E family protein [Methanomassiliicoccaceae archaeon]|nr:V-type ATP synthase subunit E family protein [Methanomassiliicoccaceae archaeon]
MALDNVTKDITDSAKATVRAIEAERDAEVAKIMAEADAVISDMKTKEDKRLKEVVEQLGRQMLSSAELESKKIVLSKKREILEKAFAESLASLESASADTKKKQYKLMVEAAKKVFDDPKAYCAKGESLTAEDIGVSDLEKVGNITGGLILESKDGTMQVDMQYRTILQTVWDREMKGLSDILFG